MTGQSIDTLVIVAGSQRAGKSTFMAKLGASKKLRAKFLGVDYKNYKWIVPPDDRKMCTQLLVSAKLIDRWFGKYVGTPLLLCHTVRWQRYASSQNLPQVKPLIDAAKRVIVVLIFPPYDQLKNRILLLRPDAITSVSQSESEYWESRKALRACCKRNGWGFIVVEDILKL